MAYQNPKHHGTRNHYGWCPSNDYQVQEVAEPALRRRFDNPRHHKGHVAFRTNNEKPIAEVEASPVAETETTIERIRYSDHNAFESVDQEADAFIKLEHRRIELAKLRSLRGA